MLPLIFDIKLSYSELENILQFNLKEIINCLECEILYKKDLIDENILFDISTDTRKLKKGDVYLPLRGENFDGHNFIDKAISIGAR